MKVWSATDMVPVHAGPLFDLAANKTEPLPDPDIGSVSVIQSELLNAAHVHPASVVTVKLLVVATDGTLELVGARTKLQPFD